jgi:hypothetical protein
MSKHKHGTRSVRSLIVLKWRARRLVTANQRARKATQKYAKAYTIRYGGSPKSVMAQVDWVEAMLK